MFKEIEEEGQRHGHKLPSFLANKMESLKESRNDLTKRIHFDSTISKDCFYWIDHQLNYINKEFSDCQDKNILDSLKQLLDKFQVTFLSPLHLLV